MLSKVLVLSPNKRTDISLETKLKFEKFGITYFKGCSLTKSQLSYLTKIAGTQQSFPLLGVTSTQLNRKLAEEFAVPD